MANARYKVAVTLLSAAVLILSALLYVSHRTHVEQSPTVETQILKAREVTFQQGKAAYNVTVWSRVHLNQSLFDSSEFFQTRIEASNDSHTFTYESPRAEGCAPSSAEIRDDLIGDGTKNLVLICELELRVVQFDGTDFVFRPKLDSLENVGSQSGFQDLDHDGRVEYIASLNFPQEFGEPGNYLTLPFPVIYRWTREQGFQEVSQEFPQFYRSQAIPELLKLKQESEDQNRKPLFDAAIAYIEQRISGSSGKQMLQHNGPPQHSNR